MATLDPKVSAILDRQQAHQNPDSDSDEDALISALEEDENDNDLSSFREQRLQQLHAELTRAKSQRASSYGTYTLLTSDKEVLDITTGAKFCVVHFMKPDFNRCRIMDQKLELLAPKHFDTRFVRIDVESAPFLVAKLKIQVLPCVICFVDGVGCDRIVGFEGLGRNPDSFSVLELEARLLKAGVLVRAKMLEEDEVRNARSGRKQVVEEDDDDDWD